MEELILVTSSKNANGISVVDFHTGAINLCSNLKNNVADPGTMCTIGGFSSFSGNNSAVSDYICVAQAKKSTVGVWSWGKGQVQMQCHVQEVLTSLSADRWGSFVIGGSKKGNLYIWEVSTGHLLLSFQAHFKEILRVKCCPNKDMLASCSGDGSARIWDLMALIDVTNIERQSQAPFRTWSPHTLPIKDMCFAGGFTTPRVFTCSLDRAVVCYDVYRGVQLIRIGLSQPLESVVCGRMDDFCFVGDSIGSIHVIDMSIVAANITTSTTRSISKEVGLSASTLSIAASSGSISQAPSSVGSYSKSSPSSKHESYSPVARVLQGHSRAVTVICTSLDNATLISASEDGTLRIWDMWTGQCLRVLSPLNNSPITNAMVVSKPEHIKLAVGGMSKLTSAPLSHLQKYKAQQTCYQSSAILYDESHGRNDEAASSGSKGCDFKLTLSPTVIACNEPILGYRRQNLTSVSAQSPLKMSGLEQILERSHDGTGIHKKRKQTELNSEPM